MYFYINGAISVMLHIFLKELSECHYKEVQRNKILSLENQRRLFQIYAFKND